MIVTDYLEYLRTLKHKEAKFLEDINNIKLGLLPNGIRYDKDKVDISPTDMYSNAFAKIDELEGELSRVQTDIFATKQIILKRVKVLPAKEKAVILSYYIDCKSISDISNYLGITERHAYRIKENGISMLQKVEEITK